MCDHWRFLGEAPMTRKNTLLVSLLGALALAVPVSAEDSPPAEEKSGYLATEPLESCVARWDAGTHMTKEAWRETCQRVSDERSDYLRKQGALPERK
jgi:hypothetical protein